MLFSQKRTVPILKAEISLIDTLSEYCPEILIKLAIIELLFVLF